MKVALVIPPYDDDYKEYGLELDWGWWQPIGLLSIASYLKKYVPDTEIMILDEQIINQFEEIKKSVKKFNPDWLCVSPDFPTYKNSLSLARLGKKLGSKVVFGGHHATNLGKVILRNRQEVDYIIVEDGEKSMLALIQKEKLGRIPNLIWRRRNGAVIANNVKWSSLDELSYVDYSLLDDLEIYFKNYRKNQKDRGIIQPFKKPMTFSAQRGCRWRERCGGCTYCTCIYSDWRGRCPGLVWDEIMRCRDIYNADALVFGEDDFLANAKWFREFFHCRPKTSKRPGIRYIYARPDSLTKKNVSQLARLNCFQIFVGFESGNDKCLKAMNKGVTVKRMLKTAKLLNEYGITMYSSFVLGAPGETKETLQDSLSLAQNLKDLGANSFSVHPFFPGPGSTAWSAAMRDCADFRSLCKDTDTLDPVSMISVWIENYCQTDLMSILEMCGAINKLGQANWDPLLLSKTN